VAEVACSLAINHAIEKGRTTIHSIIHEEKKKLKDEFVRKEKKFKAGVPLSSTKKSKTQQSNHADPNDSDIQSIIDLTASLKALEVPDCDLINGLESVIKEKAKSMDHLQKYFFGAETSGSVVELEVQIISMLKRFFSDPSPKYMSLLQAPIEVVDVLCLLATMGYEGSSNKRDLESLICDNCNMLKLVNQVNDVESTDPTSISISHDFIANFLFMLVEGSLVSHRILEKALLHSVKVSDNAKVVSKLVLDRLSSSRAGIVDATDGLVIMVRLQKVLEKDHQN